MKRFFVRLLSIVTNCTMDGHNYIGKFCRLSNVKLGFASYIGDYSKIINTRIGKYSSIGAGVKIIFGAHPTEKIVSTHPAFYSNNNCTGLYFNSNLKFDEYAYADEKEHTFVIIGNDVWIGDYVSILQGVMIGDGAVVASGSVVTHDVLPYTVVGGVPAKVIRNRFSEENIEALLRIKWWENSISWIDSHKELFKDVSIFVSTENELGRH